MKIPAKDEYAIKAILELALHFENKRPVRLENISQAQRIPKKFLVQILLRLIHAKIVRSERGASGGYYLAKHPSRVSLADVMQAMNSQLFQAADEMGKRSSLESEKIISQIWSKLEAGIRGDLSMTFDELALKVTKKEIIYQI